MTIRVVLRLSAWGIVFCAASRWRIAGVGVGELLVSTAVLTTLLAKRRLCDRSTAIESWHWFVGPSAVAMLTGTVWAFALDVWEPVNFSHDAFSLLFGLGSITILLPLLTPSESRVFFLHQFQIAGLALIGLNVLAFAIFQLFLGESTRWIGRFNGFSANPNQLALYVCAQPFWLLHTPFQSRSITAVGLAGCLLVGWLSGSDALMIAWTVGFGVWLFRTVFKPVWLVPDAFTRMMLVTGGLMAIACMIWFGWGYMVDIYTLGGQGDLRLSRWQNGLAAFRYSPLFGLGPGAFSGDETAFGNQEAHNLYIDWMTSGGLVAGSALLGFQRRTGLQLLDSDQGVLLAGYVSLLVFSCFHYVARHPIFWLHQLLFLLEATKRKSSPCVVSLVR